MMLGGLPGLVAVYTMVRPSGDHDSAPYSLGGYLLWRPAAISRHLPLHRASHGAGAKAELRSIRRSDRPVADPVGGDVGENAAVEIVKQ